MTPGYKKQVKKQKGGCMSGFLQQFSTHKRLPQPQLPVVASSSLPTFDSNQATKQSWKFNKETDSSRATCDARRNLHPKQIPTSSPINRNDIVSCDSSEQHRSPSVIGRLMGLDPLPNSESRDLFHSRLATDPNNNNNNNNTFFPDEIEKRLKMRGIHEASKDLETLKQILEALQLKGLLHTRKTTAVKQSHRNFVHDQSPVVVMKTSRLSTPPPSDENQFRGTRRSNGFPGGETTNSVSTRRSNSLSKPKPLSIETQRRVNETTDNQRLSPVHTPKSSPRRNGAEPAGNNRLHRSKESTAKVHQKVKITTAEDESFSISESSITTSTDTERFKAEEYRDGRTLLQRCDKLLNSIAEMNAIDMQPSPLSVLDYKDESLTPSPVMIKRNIDFKGELEDGLWSAVISPIRSKGEEISHDSDYAYISDVLRASHFFQEDRNVFLLLEKQQHLNGKDTSKVSRLQRKLTFDTMHEILDRNRRLPPWKAVSWTNEVITKSMLDKIWSEFQRIRERNNAEDLFETICCVLKKDLERDGISGWGDRPVEMSEVILDMERLIFKDLISEIIRDLAALASRTTFSSLMPRRKLVF